VQDQLFKEREERKDEKKKFDSEKAMKQWIIGLSVVLLLIQLFFHNYKL
jgi:hypothetical protein